MISQHVLLGEPGFTLVTCKWLLSCVSPTHRETERNKPQLFINTLLSHYYSLVPTTDDQTDRRKDAKVKEFVKEK